MQNKITLKQRLADFLAHLKIGQAKFAEEVGLSKGFANNVGDSIRADNLKKISDAYPDLNLTWLITGEGQMLKGASNNTGIAGDNYGIGSVGRMSGGRVDVSPDRPMDQTGEIARLTAENHRLREQVLQLSERVVALTDKIIK